MTMRPTGRLPLLNTSDSAGVVATRRPWVPSQTERDRAKEMKETREAHGVTQKKLAAIVGTGERSIVRYENIERPIPAQVWEKFAAHFHGRPATSPPGQPASISTPPAVRSILERHGGELTYQQGEILKAIVREGLTEENIERLVAALVGPRAAVR